jgi:hypothetical protein
MFFVVWFGWVGITSRLSDDREDEEDGDFKGNRSR